MNQAPILQELAIKRKKLLPDNSLVKFSNKPLNNIVKMTNNKEMKMMDKAKIKVKVRNTKERNKDKRMMND